MIDYRELLKKYMNHVGEEEGVHFVVYLGYDFSDEEKDGRLERRRARWTSTVFSGR